MPEALTVTACDVVAQLLRDGGVTWEVASRKEPDVPDDVITVRTTQGRATARTMVDGKLHGTFGLQFRVRSNDDLLGQLKAREVQRLVSLTVYNTFVNVEGAQFVVSSFSNIGDVLPLGFDQSSRRELFTLNAEAFVRQLG